MNPPHPMGWRIEKDDFSAELEISFNAQQKMFLEIDPKYPTPPPLE